MNDQLHIVIYFFLETLYSNIWHESDPDSDDNDCHSASAPCRNLQIVLDRVTDGADIYVTSKALSLGGHRICVIKSKLSYTLRSLSNCTIKVTCSGMYVYLLVLVLVFADSAKPLH